MWWWGVGVGEDGTGVGWASISSGTPLPSLSLQLAQRSALNEPLQEVGVGSPVSVPLSEGLLAKRPSSLRVLDPG